MARRQVKSGCFNMNAWPLLCFLLAGLTVTCGNKQWKIPEQIHIALGDSDSSMIITWSTLNDTSTTTVRYGTSPRIFAKAELGSSQIFVDEGSERRFQYIHKVTLRNLAANTTYYYKVGGEEVWSEEFSFTTMPTGESWSPSLAVYGDMGAENAVSLPMLVKEVEKGMYHAVLHVGDFAYDMDYDNGRVGDFFMKLIQPISTKVPYMTCVGNHENAYNFSNYRHRFNMPKDNKKMYYSFNMGPVHFISISTEFLYYPFYGISQNFEQYKWLEQDLEEATKPENRAKRPWIVTFGHRPMYCSNLDKDDCRSHDNLVRIGVPAFGIPGLEDLFYKYAVDVSIWAHEHSYERLWPIYNEQVKNGSYKFPYTNPKGITHIITGSAGCPEKLTPFVKHPAPWSAFHSFDYGYTRMEFLNKTHLYVEQVSSDKGGKVIDSFTLIKDLKRKY